MRKQNLMLLGKNEISSHKPLTETGRHNNVFKIPADFIIILEIKMNGILQQDFSR